MTMTERIRAVVEAAKAAGLDINERNIVDLVLDNVEELSGVAAARRAIQEAGYSVRRSASADDYGREPMADSLDY